MMNVLALLWHRSIGRLDRLVRYMIVYWLIGMSVGLVCATSLLIFDVGHLRSLLWTSNAFGPGLFLLECGFALTFGGLICATAVMFPPDAENEGSNPKRGLGQPSDVAFAQRTRQSRQMRHAFALARPRRPRR